MTLPSTYSRRKRLAANTGGDVYQYDVLSEKIRRQIVMIISESVGGYYEGDRYTVEPSIYYDAAVSFLRKEQGVHKLYAKYTENHQEELFRWIENEDRIDELLDGLEFCFSVIDQWAREHRAQLRSFAPLSADKAIAEFNARLAEAGVGFIYNDGEILRIDSTHIHSEAVLPTLNLISDAKYATVNEEYRRAHLSYRHGDYETAITECAKAFESTLKIIATTHGWEFKATDTAKSLLDLCVQNDLFPKFLEQGFGSLRSMLESSVPTIRNKTSAHGAGAIPRTIPPELATLQIHQTAVVIRYLIESSDEK